jgi:hypothetical protein
MRLYHNFIQVCHIEPPEKSGQVVEMLYEVFKQVLRQAQDDKSIFMIQPEPKDAGKESVQQ